MIEERAESARQILAQALEQAVQPALMFSGGKESIVLHHLAAPYNLPHLILYDEIQLERLDFIEALFKADPFFVLNFRPAARGLVPTQAGVDLVNVYDLRGEGQLEVAISPVHSDDYCVFDWLNLSVRNCPDFCFDLLVAGGRRDDHHDFYGRPFEATRMLGNIQLLNPLYDWSEGDVWAFIHSENLIYDHARYEDGAEAHLDTLKTCTRCFGGELRVSCPKYGREIEVAEMKVRSLKKN
jgi:hypothetical protein